MPKQAGAARLARVNKIQHQSLTGTVHTVPDMTLALVHPPSLLLPPLFPGDELEDSAELVQHFTTFEALHGHSSSRDGGGSSSSSWRRFIASTKSCSDPDAKNTTDKRDSNSSKPSSLLSTDSAVTVSSQDIRECNDIGGYLLKQDSFKSSSTSMRSNGARLWTCWLLLITFMVLSLGGLMVAVWAGSKPVPVPVQQQQWGDTAANVVAAATTATNAAAATTASLGASLLPAASPEVLPINLQMSFDVPIDVKQNCSTWFEGSQVNWQTMWIGCNTLLQLPLVLPKELLELHLSCT